jgi:diguanylate cyclase (GGDEF)-like protein
VEFDDATKLLKAEEHRIEKSSTDENAYLIVLTGPQTGEMYRIQDRLTLGRSSTADITLEGDGMSRVHCSLTMLPDGTVILRDNGSTNGTFVNGDRVSEHRLQDGDKIQIAESTILKFTYHDELEKDFQKQMYDAALRDGLTRAYNKRYFDDRLATEVAFAKRHATPLSLVMMDLDHFKKLNDTYGHLAGDYVLRELVKRVDETIRLEDVLCRYGGEEFAIICRNFPVPDAGTMAERVRRAVAAQPFVYEDTPLKVTISMGISGLPDKALEKPALLIQAADEALYQAKRGGRNRVVTHSPKGKK